MQTQNFGIRSQGSPNSIAPPSAKYFAAQGIQLMRLPTQSGPLPSQGVGGLSFPEGGGLASLGLSSSFSTAPRPSARGNAITSTAMFGGDLFSTQSISKPSSSSNSASIPPVSSAIVPANSEPQTPAKIDPLGALNAFTKQPTGTPVQSAGPSLPRPNQQAPSQNTERTQVPNTSLPQWPKMTWAGINKDRKCSWKSTLTEMGKSLFCMEQYREGQNLPPTLPCNVLLWIQGGVDFIISLQVAYIVL
ncbi:hypothetical protein Tco_1123671 [Tanacetum coccineum]|uniref:Uncharacterized protein n=1 Tax=Tanacetum coccineum TaxID=301880 RepID=A0ABQ5J401_9ASTR